LPRFHLAPLQSPEALSAGCRIVAPTRGKAHAGILPAVLATVVAEGTLARIAGTALIAAALLMKARL
jgi:hypothetical protein